MPRSTKTRSPVIRGRGKVIWQATGPARCRQLALSVVVRKLATERKDPVVSMSLAVVTVCPYPWSLLHEVRNGSNSHGGASHHPCKLTYWKQTGTADGVACRCGREEETLEQELT